MLNIVLDLLRERREHFNVLKHSVLAIYDKLSEPDPRKRLQIAFAIATKNLQKNKILKVGSHDVTKKGKGFVKRHAGEKDFGNKMKRYEKILATARKE